MLYVHCWCGTTSWIGINSVYSSYPLFCGICAAGTRDPINDRKMLDSYVDMKHQLKKKICLMFCSNIRVKQQNTHDFNIRKSCYVGISKHDIDILLMQQVTWIHPAGRYAPWTLNWITWDYRWLLGMIFCVLVYYKEMWMNKNFPDTSVQPDQLSLQRADRITSLSGETRGSCLCVLINTRGCFYCLQTCTALAECLILRWRDIIHKHD